MIAELDEINRIFREVQLAHNISEATQNIFAPVTEPNPALMLHLIQQYPDLQLKIDELAARIPVIDTEFSSSDFPTEISDRLAVIARCDKCAKAISVKDDMLWLALNEKEKVEEKLLHENKLNQDYYVEINKWAEIAQTQIGQNRQLKSEKDLLLQENHKLRALLRKNNVHVMDENVMRDTMKTAHGDAGNTVIE